MKDDIKNLVQALHDKCMTLVNPNSLYDYEVELDVDKATALIDDYIGALSRLAEPVEDARELAKKLGALKLLNEYPPQDDSGWMPGEFDIASATTEIECYVAAQVAKAREEERERCADLVLGLTLRSNLGEILAAKIRGANE